jgi:hypothetical protein
MMPPDQRATLVAIAPQQHHSGKSLFQRLEHQLGSLLIGAMGSREFDRQQVALRIHQLCWLPGSSVQELFGVQ